MKDFVGMGWNCSAVDAGCWSLMRLVARAVGCHDSVLVAERCDDCFGDCSDGLNADFGCSGV